MKVKILVAVGILLLLIGYNSYSPHCSDKKMIAHFLTNEEDYNQLVEMFSEDSKVEMIIGEKVYAFDADGKILADERLQEYKRLLDKTNVNYGIRRSKTADTQNIILVSTSDSSEPNEYNEWHTPSKGFVYSMTEPTPIRCSDKVKK